MLQVCRSRLFSKGLKIDFMKRTAVFLMVVVLFACKKEDSNSNELERIQIDNLESLLPKEQLIGGNSVVFTSSSGEEKTLTIEIKTEVKTQMIEGRKYEVEAFSIGYYDTSLDEYSLYLLGSGNYTDTRTYNLYVTAGLVQWITGYSPFIGIAEDGIPTFGQFLPSKEIAGRTFKDVYMNLPAEGYESYGQIYYSAEWGVIGFADKDGVLFSLKEIMR